MHSIGKTGRLDPSPLGALLICGLVAVLAVVADVAIGPGNASLTREGGPVEMCSALFYLAALAALYARPGRSRTWPGMIVLAAMCLREFDADKRFTSEGLLSTKIFVYDTALWEKALAAAVLAILLSALAALLWSGSRRLWRGARAGANWALLMVAAIALAAVSKSIDGLGRKLASFGIAVPEQVVSRTGQVEEVMELGIPVLLLMSILSLRPSRSG